MMAHRRIKKFSEQLTPLNAQGSGFQDPGSGFVAVAPTNAQINVFGQLGSKGDDDVVIVSAKRTAITKARRGAFKDTTPDDLLVAVFDAVIKDTKLDPKRIDDVVVGNVQLSGAYALPARTAMFRAGIPQSSSVRAVNRQCSSGIQAVASIAADIKAGFIDCGIGAGVESMTMGGKPGEAGMPPANLNAVFEEKDAAACLTPMGITSESVASRYGISREEQDKLAYESHAKAVAAQSSGKFIGEIVPVSVTTTDKEGNEADVVVTKDEGPRPGTTLEGLSKLRPAFQKGGTTTAGNSSQVSDGAAAVLLMRRRMATELGLKPLATFRGYKVQGCDPAVMGIGPAVAIPALCESTGIRVQNVDIFELNEAFASQAAYCVKTLGIPMEKLNPNGGAIALGHPLGCTGARQVATILPELKRQHKKLGVISMCVGTGMGAAALIENESD